MGRLYSFGFNAFGQIDSNSNHKAASHNDVSAVLLATWESTFILTDAAELRVWGYQPSEIDTRPASSLTQWGDARITRMFGDLNSCLGAVDDQGSVWCRVLGSTQDTQILASKARDAVYCHAHEAIYVLTVDGTVDRYCKDGHATFEWAEQLADLPYTYAIAASATHVLFYTSGMDPVYALGSNRFSQLGFDTLTAQSVDTPTPIDYFSGLGMMDPEHRGMVACGLFHSAVVLGGELYTFGWNKTGRLGWGDDDDDDDGEDQQIISPAIFADTQGKPVQQEDVNIVQIACGAAHTLVMDDQARVWSSGSSLFLDKYGQLGRETLWQIRRHEIDDDDDDGDYDTVFRQCTVVPSSCKAKGCFAGRWSSFILV